MANHHEEIGTTSVNLAKGWRRNSKRTFPR